jgi:hypothetical protein
VIAPKLVATTVWPAEIASWPHLKHLRVAVLDGSPEQRRRLLATACDREVTVIGVDLVPWLVGELAAVADDHPLFDALIVDETSRLKGHAARRAPLDLRRIDHQNHRERDDVEQGEERSRRRRPQPRWRQRAFT